MFKGKKNKSPWPIKKKKRPLPQKEKSKTINIFLTYLDN
jgi:hypothetical protein